MTKPEACLGCPLYSAPGPAWGTGPRDAKLMFVGEALGEEEARAHLPFIGGAGRVLSALCAHARLSRDASFVTNVVKCRPTTSGGKNRKPTPAEIRHCAPFLAGELDTVQPNVIVALGNVPMQTLTGATDGILKVRSVPTEGPKRHGKTYKVIGTVHPAGVMRQQNLWPAVVFDLVRAQEESKTPVISRRPWTRHIHASLQTHREHLERGVQQYRRLLFDLETTGLNPHTNSIRCIGLASSWEEVYCFDWTPDVQQYVRERFADASLLKVGQNSEAFDIFFCEEKGFPFEGSTFDTMIGFHVLNSALPKKLEFIGACYTDEVHWKHKGMYKEGVDELQHGCCKDVHATGRAFEEEHKELSAYDQLDLYYRHIMPLQPVLRRMRKRGIRKDPHRAAGWSLALSRMANELEAKLKRGLGDATFSVESPKQLRELLYDRMGLPVQWKETEQGRVPTVDADALDALALLTKNPIFTLVRTIRTLRKTQSTYVECEHDEQNFVHTTFGTATAATGRLNSFDPALQNWPQSVREIIVPSSPEHVLYAADWSQIEWRLAMVSSGDPVGLRSLVQGIDPHTAACAENWGKPAELVTAAERFEAKCINYGLLYGRGEESISNGRAGHPESMVPIARVGAYVKRMKSTFRTFFEYRAFLERHVAQHHYLKNAWKRRRWWYTSQVPEFFNFPMQSNAADMMYDVLIALDKDLPKGATLRLTIHDEIVAESLKETVRQTEECVLTHMQRTWNNICEASFRPENVYAAYPNGWFCKADGHFGETWKACKPDTVEEKAAEQELRRRLGC